MGDDTPTKPPPRPSAPSAPRVMRFATPPPSMSAAEHATLAKIASTLDLIQSEQIRMIEAHERFADHLMSFDSRLKILETVRTRQPTLPGEARESLRALQVKTQEIANETSIQTPMIEHVARNIRMASGATTVGAFIGAMLAALVQFFITHH